MKRYKGEFSLVLFAMVAGLLCQGEPAFAGGFEFPDNGAITIGRGGAMTASVDDPSALRYNPANLSRIPGFSVLGDFFMHRLDSTFDRAGSHPMTGEEFPMVENGSPFFPAGWLLAAYNVGWQDLTIALGVFGPSAVGARDFPDDGPQRYMFVSENIILLYYSLGAGISVGDFRFGLCFQLAHLMLEYRQHVDADVNADKQYFISEENPDFSTPAQLEASDLQPTGIVGVTWEIDRAFELALSARMPMWYTAKGKVVTEFPEAMEPLDPGLNDDNLTIEISEPLVMRFGARFNYVEGDKEIFDLELDVVYEAWSIQDEFKLTFDGEITLFGADEGKPLGTVILAKRWEDVLSFRLGSDINVTDWLTLRIGGFFESSTTPNSTTNLDYIPFARIGVGGGATFKAGDFDFTLGFQYIYQPDREVSDSEFHTVIPLNDCPAPFDDPDHCPTDDDGNLRAPSDPQGNGKYTSSFMTFALGIIYHPDW